MKTGWVFEIKKAELTIIAAEFDIEGNGSLEELRKSFVAFINSSNATEVQEQSHLFAHLLLRPINIK